MPLRGTFSETTSCKTLLDSPRFVVDGMLGRLVRWLRALGYDTLYNTAWEDAALAEIARTEDRILLTRDVELTRRRNLRAILIREDRVLVQLRQVVAEVGLNAGAAFSRCVECNTALESLAAEQAAPLVPPYVLQSHSRFRRCPRCGRVYWRGTHWSRMREVLEGLEYDE